MDLNLISLTGRLVKDPLVAKSKAGKDYLAFSIASNYGKDKDNKSLATFIDCYCFKDKFVDSIKGYLVKGIRIGLEGRLRAIVDKDPKKTRLYVDVDSIVLLSSKAKDDKTQADTTDETMPF